MTIEEKYYVSKIDIHPETIYVHHGAINESFIPTHQHNKGQFLYTEGGIVYVKTEEQTYYLPSRHYIWIPPNVKHSIHPSTEQAIMRNIYFPIFDNSSEFATQSKIYPVNELIKELLDYSSNLDGDIFPDEKNYTIIKAFYYLLEKYSSFSLPLALPVPQEERLKEIINFLNENINQKIKLPEISKQFGISLRSMTRLFSKHLGLTFVEYLTILRILKALELLLKTNKNINEICLDIGYTSVPTFSNVFQKMVGVRPAEYRKMKGIIK